MGMYAQKRYFMLPLFTNTIDAFSQLELIVQDATIVRYSKELLQDMHLTFSSTTQTSALLLVLRDFFPVALAEIVFQYLNIEVIPKSCYLLINVYI